MSPRLPNPSGLQSWKRSWSWILKALASFWILFHLAVLLITPNSSSFLGRRYSVFFTAYANQLGFHNMWNFFSPDPASAMVFQSTIRFLNKEGEEVRESVVQMVPPTEEKMVMDSTERRILYATRFFFVNPDLIQKSFVPWQCRRFSGASRVGVLLRVHMTPNLDQAILQRETSISDLVSPREVYRNEASCEDYLP
ncbi:MAG: hypothetical protein WCH11_00035 [Bdellovibrio sp.]